MQLLALAKGLAERGHHVVVATRPSSDWRERCTAAGLGHYALPMRSEVDVRSVPGLIGIIRRHGIDVVHCHKGKARTLALMAGLFVKIPVLVLNRGVSFPLDPFNRLGYTTPRVDAIVAVSQSIKRSLVARGVSSEKIHVIYSGTDTQRFHPGVDGRTVRAELGVMANEYLITQIGVRSWKGNDDLLHALGMIGSRISQARVLFVGANEAKAAILRQKTAERGLLGRILVLPFRDDVPQILKASDVCVDSSYAGLGITGTLREALAVHTPVIATDLEGNPELIEDGHTGLLVPPQRPDALARALVRSMENPEAAQAMARAGRERVVAMFSQEVKVRRTEALYERLLARALRGGGERARTAGEDPQDASWPGPAHSLCSIRAANRPRLRGAPPRNGPPCVRVAVSSRRIRVTWPAGPAWIVLAVSALIGIEVSARAFTTNDHARFPVLAQDILARGDWFWPRLNGAVYHNKPPLLAWLIAATSWPHGHVTEFTAVLPSAVSATGVVWLTYMVARNLFDPEARRYAALFAMTMQGLFFSAHLALPDTLMTAVIPASVWILVRMVQDPGGRWWVFFYGVRSSLRRA